MAVILTIVGLAIAAWLARARFWPYARCPGCRGRKGRGVGSADSAFSRCRWCGGSGEYIRPSARIWRKWRDEAGRR